MNKSADILNVDKVPEELSSVLIIVSLVGSYLVIGEMSDEYPDFFCQNMTKKIILWCVVYVQTKSISTASLVCIVVVLLFPRIFFGKLSGSRVKKSE